MEVIKSMSDSGRVEFCPDCGTVMTRIFSPTQIVGAKVGEAEFNFGLGCVVKNKKHREELCRRRNLIEIGNEKPSSLKRLADKTLKNNLDKTWEKD